MRNIILSAAFAASVAGCATVPELAYIRTDGQHIKNDPVLEQQFQVDAAICNGEMQKANVSGITFTNGGIAGAVAAANRSTAVSQVGQGCMAEKGYVIVQKDQADQKIAEFAAINAEKKRREAEEARMAQIKLPQKKKQSASAQSQQQ